MKGVFVFKQKTVMHKILICYSYRYICVVWWSLVNYFTKIHIYLYCTQIIFSAATYKLNTPDTIYFESTPLVLKVSLEE